MLLLDGGSQLVFSAARVFVGAHLGMENLDAIGARTLGAIHGDLGFAQQFSRILVGAVINGDADGGRENDFLAGDGHGRAHRAANLFGQHGEFARVGLAEQQQRGLVRADAGQRILRPQVAAESARHREQETVADHQAECRVGRFEFVDVDEQQGRPDQRPDERGPLGGNRQPVQEQLAIGKAGKAVVHGVVQQAFLGALVVGHFAQQSDAAQVAAVGGRHAGSVQLEPAIGIVHVPHAELDAHVPAGAFLHRP